MLVSCGIEGNGARGQLFADKDWTVRLRQCPLRAVDTTEKCQSTETQQQQTNNNARMEIVNSHVNESDDQNPASILTCLEQAQCITNHEPHENA